MLPVLHTYAQHPNSQRCVHPPCPPKVDPPIHSISSILYISQGCFSSTLLILHFGPSPCCRCMWKVQAAVGIRGLLLWDVFVLGWLAPSSSMVFSLEQRIKNRHSPEPSLTQEMRKCMQGDLKRLWSMWIISQCGISQMWETGIAFKII